MNKREKLIQKLHSENEPVKFKKEFIPDDLDVRNLSTYLGGAKDRAETLSFINDFFDTAERFAPEGFNLNTLRLTTASEFGLFSKDALVFVITREESIYEFYCRMGRLADEILEEKKHEKSRQLRVLRNAQKDLKTAQRLYTETLHLW